MFSSIHHALAMVLGDMKKPIALSEPCFQGNEWTYLKECLDSGWVSSVGAYVDLFEEKLAETCQVDYAVVVVNGTEALHIALKLVGVEPGDEVLCPPMTFIATANAISYCQATPHFVEVEEQSLGIDAKKLSDYLALHTIKKEGALYNMHTNRRIAAIVPVHVFGHPADMDALLSLAEEYNLPLIEEATEALGSLYKDQPAGSFGCASVLSFNGNKIITTGGGGAILTSDAKLAARAKHITTTAKVPHKWAFSHDEIGYNFRMPNLNAALGCAQLEQLETFFMAKRELACRYASAFRDIECCQFFSEAPGRRSNYWLNAIILNEDLDRDMLLDELHRDGYLCRPVWTLLHKLPIYENCPKMDLSVAETLERRIINIPSNVAFGNSA